MKLTKSDKKIVIANWTTLSVKSFETKHENLIQIVPYDREKIPEFIDVIELYYIDDHDDPISIKGIISDVLNYNEFKSDGVPLELKFERMDDIPCADESRLYNTIMVEGY